MKPRASIPPSLHLSKVYTQGSKNCLQLCKVYSRSHAVSVHFFDYYIFSCLPPLFVALLFWAKEKRWHPDCCQASVVSSFLTLLWWEGGRVKSRDHVEMPRCPPCLFSFTSTSCFLCSLHSHRADLHSSCCFPSTLFFFQPFLSLPCFSFLFIHTRKDGISNSDERLPIESVRDSKQSWAHCDCKFNLGRLQKHQIVILLWPYCDLIVCVHCVWVGGSLPISGSRKQIFFAFSFCYARQIKADQQRALLVLSSVVNERFFNRFFFWEGQTKDKEKHLLSFFLQVLSLMLTTANDCQRKTTELDVFSFVLP